MSTDILPTSAEKKLILQYANADVKKLALKLHHTDDVRPQYVLQQIAGKQILQKKVPSWSNSDILYPIHLSVEQCSSEITAKYKAKVAQRLSEQYNSTSLVDLTGGFGVDFYFMSELFQTATYIEQNQELANIVAHNFVSLHRQNCIIHCSDGVHYLNNMSNNVGCIYIDPARRNESGGKTVRLPDCTPDLTLLEKQLVEKADFVIAKLSPMLDISAALDSLQHVTEVHIVSVNNECKELLLVMQRKMNAQPMLYAVTNEQILHFTLADEQNAQCTIATEIGQYLYEPSSSLLKAGAFKITAQHYDIEKLHPSSHLYTSNKLVKDFMGRTFRVLSVGALNRNALPITLSQVRKANIATRNFPLRPDEIRKKLKITDGGDDFIFGTTTFNGQKIIIHCKKVIYE